MSYAKSESNCRRGHDRRPENISVRPNGDIRCMACERANKRFNRYGLTEEQWNAVFAAQGYACAVCRSAETKTHGWHTDHDHKTGTFRGILCDACNRALGAVDDRIEILQNLIAYLKRNLPHGNLDRNNFKDDGVGKEVIL